MLCDRYPKRLSLAVLSVVAGLAMYLAIRVPHGTVMVAALLVSGLAVHMIWPIFFVVYAERTPPSLRGTGMGSFSPWVLVRRRGSGHHGAYRHLEDA
jgi:predicted MFS family arabinose efflux permease